MRRAGFRYIGGPGPADTQPCEVASSRAAQGGRPIGDGLEPGSASRVVEDEPDLDHRWYREPQQARSWETLDRFLAAIEELLADQTFDELTIADIAARADRTVGSFYGRFADKDAALRALHARYLAEDLPYLEEFLHPSTWRGERLEAIVRCTTSMFVMAYRHPRPSFRPVILRAATDAAFREQCMAAAARAGRAWRRLIVSRAGEIDHPEPGYAADLCYRHVFAVLDHELLFGPVLPGSGATDDRLIDDLTAATLAVLGARGA